MRYVYVFAWDAFVWAGWAYLVTAHGWSAWWVILALGLSVTFSSTKQTK